VADEPPRRPGSRSGESTLRYKHSQEKARAAGKGSNPLTAIEVRPGIELNAGEKPLERGHDNKRDAESSVKREGRKLKTESKGRALIAVQHCRDKALLGKSPSQAEDQN